MQHPGPPFMQSFQTLDSREGKACDYQYLAACDDRWQWSSPDLLERKW